MSNVRLKAMCSPLFLFLTPLRSTDDQLSSNGSELSDDVLADKKRYRTQFDRWQNAYTARRGTKKRKRPITITDGRGTKV